MYSKNRIDEDGSELEDLLEKLLHLKNAVYYKRENTAQIALTASPQIIADFEFETVEECFAQLDINFTLRNSDADAVLLTVNVNGTDVPRNFIQSVKSGDIELTHVYHLVGQAACREEQNLRRRENQKRQCLHRRRGHAGNACGTWNLRQFRKSA